MFLHSLPVLCIFLGAVLAAPEGIQININSGQPGNGSPNFGVHPVTEFRPDYTNYGSSFYKYHRVPQIWAKARQICEAEGAHLAIINTNAEADLLLTIMNKYPASELADVVHKDFVLLGFHDHFMEGEYLTLKEHPLEGSGFIRWATGQPDNAGTENCGSFHRSGGLNDFPCATPSPFICEKENTLAGGGCFS